ncbi:MAG: VCBS repeat-containing protein [Desulfuromonadales bacterium]
MLKNNLFRILTLLTAVSIMNTAHVSLAARTVPDPGDSAVFTSVAINFSALAEREALAPQTRNSPVAAPRHLRGMRSRVVDEESTPSRDVISGNTGISSAQAPTVTGFQAIVDNNTSIPPDTQGAVGPSHVMTTLNSEVRIQSKTGTIISTVPLSSFFSTLKNASNAAFDVFDPHVRFDPIGSRWVIAATADGEASTSATLVGVSQTTDPTGNWYLMSIRADSTGTNWADYPALGMNKDWIVITVNLFGVASSKFVNSKIYLLNKAQMYAGSSISSKIFTDTAGGFTLQPAVTHDASLATLYLLDSWNSNSGGKGYLRLSTITGAVGSEVFTAGTFQPNVTSPWDGGSVGEIMPQLGDTHKIDGGDDRMLNCQYRNSSLWCAHTVYLPAASPTRSAAQWWQINPATGTVQQFGRVDDATGVKFYAYPTIAVNKNSDVLLGYSSFSATQYPSANYSFRYGTDTSSTLQASTVFKAGEAKYYKTFSGTANRWGDYSSTVVDPADDLTLWTIQEYSTTPSGGSDRWATWWAQVTVTSSYALSVAKSGTGSGTVTSSPAGISCGATCSANYASGTSVTLTAAPASGSTFGGWSGACSGSGTCTVAMSSAKSVTATFTLAPTTNTPSILYYHQRDGVVAGLTTDGSSITGGSQFYAEANAAWSIVGQGDFDGDGIRDLVWWNSRTGQIYIMLMASSTTIKSGAIVYTEPNTYWRIVATGDLNGDGKTDLIWWNQVTGQVVAMLMDGTTVTGTGQIYSEPDTSWKIVAAADFNGNGKAELLWWNSRTGQVAIGSTNGTNASSASLIYTVSDTNWRIAGAGDLDGDGKADIVWHNRSTGEVYGMQTNGSSVTNGATIYVEPNTYWEIVSVGNYNGDKKADLLWWNELTGQVYLMTMNGLTSTGGVSLYSEPDTTWNIQGETEWRDKLYGRGVTTTTK